MAVGTFAVRSELPLPTGLPRKGLDLLRPASRNSSINPNDGAISRTAHVSRIGAPIWREAALYHLLGSLRDILVGADFVTVV